MNDDNALGERSAIIDRELLKRDPSAERKLETATLYNRGPFSGLVAAIQPCLPHRSGARSL